jgi:hypothetical protein
MLVSASFADAHSVDVHVIEALVADVTATIVVAGRVSRWPACGGEV